MKLRRSLATPRSSVDASYPCQMHANPSCSLSQEQCENSLDLDGLPASPRPPAARQHTLPARASSATLHSSTPPNPPARENIGYVTQPEFRCPARPSFHPPRPVASRAPSLRAPSSITPSSCRRRSGGSSTQRQSRRMPCSTVKKTPGPTRQHFTPPADPPPLRQSAPLRGDRREHALVRRVDLCPHGCRKDKLADSRREPGKNESPLRV